MREVAGFHLRLGEGIDPTVNANVHALARALEADRRVGVTEIIPSYASVFIEYETLRLSEERVRQWVEGIAVDASATDGKAVSVGVRYDGQDLADVAAATDLDVAEVVRRHSRVEYLVYAVGFTPGFAFMGTVDPAIRVPRLPSPRPRVEANTVAIADAQTGIYPLPSPGGWRQLGTALEAIYDPHRKEPFLLGPGDRVRFVPDDARSSMPRDHDVETAALGPAPLELLPVEPRWPALSVLQPGLLDLVVDAGRFGVGRYGLARSGPLDARSAAIANRLVGNDAASPLLELNVSGPELAITRDVVLAFAGFGVAPLLNGVSVPAFSSFAARAGDRLEFPPQRRGVRGYLALAGGIESERFMGSASVDVRGLIGRPLRAGDVLGSAEPRRAVAGRAFEPYARWPTARMTSTRGTSVGRNSPERISTRAETTSRESAIGRVPPRVTAVLRLLPGPQAGSEALRALAASRFRVVHADRMGIQFDGPAVPGGGILSEANPLGAVQVTTSGKPLILMHDRGSIGGYTKPAVVHPRDLHIAGQLRDGDLVRFVAV